MQIVWAWNLCLHRTKLEIRYMRISEDHCIHMHNTPSGLSIVTVHIYDMAMVAFPTQLNCKMVRINTGTTLGVTIGVRLSRSCHERTKAQKSVSSTEKTSTNVRLN